MCASRGTVDSHSFTFCGVSEGPYEMIRLRIVVFGLGNVKLFNPDDKKANGYQYV